MTKNITSVEELEQFLSTTPEGTTTDVLASDLETGNFDTAHFVFPDGHQEDVKYEEKK